ncbi:MAG: helix-turn-helix domain-containing protein [Eubacterium sp.]|nr:helix-turn-helix domain-containing protein [Eubacterium sp.]
MTFSERLKIARETSGFTGAYIANKMGITPTTYTRYEKGERQPNVEGIKQLSDILNISADFLLNTNAYNKNAVLNESEKKLLTLFNQVNNEGKEKIIELADDMVCTGKYSLSKSKETKT